MEDKDIIHVVTQFIGAVARTSCGGFADVDKVTVYYNEATCKKCRGEKEFKAPGKP